MIIRISLALIILLGNIYNLSFAQEQTETIKEKLDNYEEKTKAKWKYNPFRRNDIERRLIGWQDPYANITRFWIGSQLNANQMYPNPNVNTEHIAIYFSPTIATEFSVIAFDVKNLKFRLGVGVLAEFNLALYGNNYSPKYGKNFIFTDYIQVEVYFDFIIDESWKFRWIPIRHKCFHASGDFLGDPLLHNTKTDAFADLGYEEMHFALYYQWSWFTFYGGFGVGFTNLDTTNYATLFSAFWGTDFRVPIWGTINFITGLYVSADYDKINTITRTETGYQLDHSFTKWYPTISLGIGFEIDRFTIGLKYLHMRSRQVTSYRAIEERIGFEASVFY